MRFLLFADLQATEGSEMSYLDPTVPLQRARVDKFFEILGDIYADHGCSGLIDLGDTLDDRSSVPVPTINSVLRGIDPFKGKWNFKLVGNHEQFFRDGRVHAGKLFEHRFTVIDGVREFKSPDSAAIFIFAAYPGNYVELVSHLEELTDTYRDSELVLFGHFQVVGCQLNSGLAYEGVPQELMKRFTIGFLGHVHKPQTVAPNVYYVGSPFQQNFGESGEAKRVAIFDTLSMKVTWVSLADYGFPVYRTVTAREFTEQVEGGSEDRFHVVLSSEKDTEIFYAHPLCNRADPEYSYTTVESLPASTPKSWSFESVLKRFIELNPPKNAGIEISDEEMLEIGMQVASGNE